MPSLPLQPPPPPASRWEWAQTALLVVNLGWTTLANGGYGARIALVTLLLTAALLGVHALAAGWENTPGRCRPHPAGWLLLPFLTYALAHVVWVTPVRWLGWFDWLGWAQLIAVFWVALNAVRSRGPRRTLFYTLVALGLGGVLMGCYQHFVQPDWRLVGTERPPSYHGRASGSFGVPNSFAGFLLLVLPAVAALALRRRAAATERVWWGWVTAVFLLGLLLTLSRGAWLALVVALPAWPLLAGRGGWRRRTALALGVFLVVGAVVAVAVAKFPRARERLVQLVHDRGEVTRPHMWRGAWGLWRDAPWLGTGAGSFNVLFERHRPEGFRDEPMWAHNEYLNTLSDYGAIGGLLFFGAAAGIAGGAMLRPRPNRKTHHGLADPFVVAGMATGLLAFALQMTVDFHLKIPALALAAAVLAALAVGAAWPGGNGRFRSTYMLRLSCLAFAGTIATTVLVFFRPKLEAEARRTEARHAIDQLYRVSPGHPNYRLVIPVATGALESATKFDPANAQAWSDLAYATSLLAFEEPARAADFGRDAESSAERALQLAPACGEFWLRRGSARDMQGRWTEAGEDFAAAVKLSPADATAWCYYADHLFRRPFTRNAAEVALSTCLRLDPWNHAGVTLRQRLAIKAKAP